MEFLVRSVLVIGVALAACSKPPRAAESTPPPASVTIRGMATHKFLGCASHALTNLDGRQISVFDQNGTLIATARTSTGEANCTKEAGGTIVTAPYIVEVPARSFYKLQVDDVPSVSTLAGAASCSSVTISRTDLAAANDIVFLYTGMTRPDLLSGAPGPTC